jgi:hypothetical protein
MFHWGHGPALGLLTCLGYCGFAIGGIRLWCHREEFSFWMDHQLTLFRRNLSRHVPAGPFYEPRGESRLRLIPFSVIRSFTELPRRRFSWGAFFLFLGAFLLFLDFFV